MLTRGDKLAHYTIESLLGAGGMGAVYLAVDSRLHRRVALKVILDSDKPEEMKESAARLLREARAAASLAHPNIVGVFDVGEIDGRVYLAMEYVVGKTLRDLMRDDTIAWQRRLRWLVEVARALGAAHRDGLVHRDIKPENVMVRDDGLVKVLDFGIARRTAASSILGVDPTGKTEQAHVALTGKGLVIGTPMYMAPEQLKGGDPDTRTDQFAWGVMSYEVLSGERPWPEKSDLLAAVATILTEDPASIRKHAADLPPAVESAIARTLARNPDDRFESMDEIAELLEPLAVRSGPTIESRKSSPSTARAARISGRDLPKEEKEEEHRSTKQAMVTAKSPEHPLAPPPQEKTRWSRGQKRTAFAAGVLVTLLGTGVFYKYRRPTIVTTPTSTDSATVPPPPSSATPLPSENPDALAAYQEGVQQWRDGSERRSRASLDRAAALDPGFSAAHLELAVQMLVSGEAQSRVQEHYQKAYSHRDRLGAREAEVLAALEPLVRASSEPDAAEKKLAAAAAKYKKDPIFEYLLGYVRETRLEYEQARTDYERAIARDGAFMPALLAKGHVLLQLGNPDAALETYGKCIHSSAAAAICLEQRILLLRDRGECDAMEQDARAWQGVEPEAWDASYWVAAALAARGAPIQSVQIALRRQWDAMPKDERVSGEAEDTANRALAQGDFNAAERATVDWESSRTKQDVFLHSGPQQQLAFIAYETGDVQKAARIADGFLKILPALTPSPVGNDPTIWTAEYMFRGGRMSKQDLEEKRKTWLKEREANRTQQENMRLAPFRWAQVYAAFAETLDEAKDALDKQSDFLPLPPESRRPSSFDAELGKTYALAGRYDDALAPLRAVTKACIALGQPILQTRSFYFLGMALEGKGDLDGAKKAYQAVIDRWGSAKPRSVTAEAAKKRLKVLE